MGDLATIMRVAVIVEFNELNVIAYRTALSPKSLRLLRHRPCVGQTPINRIGTRCTHRVIRPVTDATVQNNGERQRNGEAGIGESGNEGIASA